MSRFSILKPYFIVVICLALMVIGVTSLVSMTIFIVPATCLLVYGKRETKEITETRTENAL